MKKVSTRHTAAHKGRRRAPREFNIDYQDDDIVIVTSVEFQNEPEPVRVPRNGFYFCYAGDIDIETSEGHYSLHPGDTFICPTGTFVKLKYISPDTKFSALLLTDRIVQSLLNANVAVWNNIVYVMKERVVPADKEGDVELKQKMGWHFAEIMRAMLAMKDRPFRKEMIYLMLQLGLLGFCARYKQTAVEEKESEHSDSNVTQSQLIFSKFMEVLQAETIKHRPVYYYAERLCITSKYLSYVCKAVSGKSASEFIQNAVIGEIMHYLDHTTLSVKEISNRMGFPNISFFGKYVKTHLGVSPNKYRK